MPSPITSGMLLDRDHAFARDQIATLAGAAFDDAYMRVALHRDDAAIALYMQEARFGGEPILMRFAADGVSRFEQEKQLAARMMAALPR